MQEPQAMLASLEGRLMAHRALIARLIAMLSPDQRSVMDDWLTERNVMSDGQEDPGAVPDLGAATELALADEMRLIQERISRQG